jgi:hypothetical protein
MKKNTKTKFVLSLLIVLFFVIEITAAKINRDSNKQPYSVPKVSAKIKVDGLLDEKVWDQALVLELEYEVEPGENIPPPVKTQVLLAYSPTHLYIGFRAGDPNPGQIRARYTDRDNIDNDDYVGIVLDTFNDSRRAYRFYCNPYGIQADHIITAISSKTVEWDGIWDSSAVIGESGYRAEMAIPFSTLRFQGKKSRQVWGIDAIRNYPRNVGHRLGLFPRDRNNNCYLCQAEKVKGFKGIKPGINLELDPTLSTLLSWERENFPTGKLEEKRCDIDLGLTARWSFTPNLTLTAALNPDFSHVEADAAQLDINTQFMLFYPEKRPFFLEGISIFRSVLYAVHTRSIVNPAWGVKITGKQGKHAIGFFSVQDSLTNLLFPGSENTQTTTLDMKSIGTVLRYRWDIGRSSNLGFFITDREGSDYFNRVASIDGDLRITAKNRFSFQYLGSQTRYPDEIARQFNQPRGKFQGSVLDIGYRHETRNVSLYTYYQDAGPDFRADLGFIDQTGVLGYVGGGEYRWRHNPGHWYTTISIEGAYTHVTDHNKRLLQKLYQTALTYNGPLQSSLNLQVNLGKRTYLGEEFNGNTVTCSGRLRPSGSLFLGVSGTFGDQVDFTNIQPGQLVHINPVLQYNPGNHLYLELDHVYERLRVEAGRLYTANLSNMRLVYQFSRRAFIRAILQYADIRYDTGLYTVPLDPEFKHLFSQVLFSYKINPQTVLFLGYSDDYYGYGNIPLKQANRTLFLKIGYALVL